jgi:hypothetical protein
MARGNPGRIFTVKEGVHEGKLVIAYHKDQAPEVAKAKKILAWVTVDVEQAALFEGCQKQTSKQVLFDPSKLTLTGFID